MQYYYLTQSRSSHFTSCPEIVPFSDCSAPGFYPGSHIISGHLVTSLPFSLDQLLSLTFVVPDTDSFEKYSPFLQNVTQFGFV